MSSSGKMGTQRKVLYLNHVSFIGGAESSLLTVLAQSKRALHIPAVLCPREGPLVDRLQELGVRHVPFNADIRLLNEAIEHFLNGLYRHPLKSLNFAYTFSRSQAALLKRLMAERPTIVHANSWPMGQFSALAVKMLGIPAVCHVRDLAPVGRGQMEMLGMARNALKLYDRLIAISEASRQYLIARGFAEEKVVRIYNGVDLRSFDPKIANGTTVRDEFELPIDGIVVSQFGQICDQKDQLGFLRAAKLLLARHTNIVFLVVGREFNIHLPVTRQLESFIEENGMSQYVKMLGFVSHVQEPLAASDIVVSAGINEAFGRTLIEGMAMEKPVVATRSGGHPEIVEEDTTGLLVPERDANALAAAISRLIERPDLRTKMGKAGRVRAERLFSAETHVAHLDRLYKEVTKDRGDFWTPLTQGKE